MFSYFHGRRSSRAVGFWLCSEGTPLDRVFGLALSCASKSGGQVSISLTRKCGKDAYRYAIPAIPTDSQGSHDLWAGGSSSGGTRRQSLILSRASASSIGGQVRHGRQAGATLCLLEEEKRSFGNHRSPTEPRRPRPEGCRTRHIKHHMPY